MTRKQKNICMILFVIQFVLILGGLIVLGINKPIVAVLIIPFSILENLYAKKLDKIIKINDPGETK